MKKSLCNGIAASLACLPMILPPPVLAASLLLTVHFFNNHFLQRTMRGSGPRQAIRPSPTTPRSVRCSACSMRRRKSA